ncbi:MAG: Ig-like domain repeat protein [Anaerolineales bacterium]|nr:Ig-like domain repeat protein [Anaerolineales bacterium]
MKASLKPFGLIGVLLIATALMLAAGAFFITQQGNKAEIDIDILPLDPAALAAGEDVTVNFRVNDDNTPYSVVVLPDTQYYSEEYPEIYIAQTQWIVDNRAALNIRFVTHEGDIVDNDDQYKLEWQRADEAMQILDGEVPYGFLPGNHDMQPDGTANYYREYFPASRYESYDWWGGSFSDNKNNYQFFSGGGEDYIVIHLQFCPTDAAIDWANEVLAEYPDYRAIITTHAYLYESASRFERCIKNTDGTNNGLDMWAKMIRPNTNVFMVLAGHVPGVSQRVDEVDGRLIYQMLADYQAMENGGNGYLRILTFQPAEDAVQVQTYSPTLDEYMTDPENEFSLGLGITGGPQATGTVTVSAGEASCTAAVEQGSCTLTLPDSGETKLVAEYSGDNHYNPGTSRQVTITVK